MSEEHILNYKIVLFDTSGPGKTCIIYRYMTGNFSSNILATPGASFTTKTIIMKDENQSIKFEIWDTTGSKITT